MFFYIYIVKKVGNMGNGVTNVRVSISKTLNLELFRYSQKGGTLSISTFL